MTHFGIERIPCGQPRHEGNYIDDDGFHQCADCIAAENRVRANREIIYRNHLGVAGGHGRSGDCIVATAGFLGFLISVALLCGVAIAAVIVFSK